MYYEITDREVIFGLSRIHGVVGVAAITIASNSPLSLAKFTRSIFLARRSISKVDVLPNSDARIPWVNRASALIFAYGIRHYFIKGAIE